MNYESPLCPDGYSGFVQLDTNRYNYVQVFFLFIFEFF